MNLSFLQLEAVISTEEDSVIGNSQLVTILNSIWTQVISTTTTILDLLMSIPTRWQFLIRTANPGKKVSEL